VVRGPSARRTLRGSSAAARAAWRRTYDREKYTDLPWFEAGPSDQVRRAVRDRFWAPRSSVLDIGCGAGSNVLYLARHGYRALGVDLSPGAVRAARDRAERAGLAVSVREGDALALPFARRRLDGATDNGCFHTLPIPRRGEYAREVARVLRPGGGFVLAWVAREYTKPLGPPHRPSVGEIAEVFEAQFHFEELMSRPGSDRHGLPAYVARMTRRRSPQPPRR
jgi:SAM-dependent methyltransferase